VQNKINDLLWFGETLVAEDGMGDRKGDRTQSAGGLHDVQSQLILVWQHQRADRSVDQLIVGLLFDSEAVVVRCIPMEPQRSEQGESSSQPLLQDGNRCDQPVLNAQAPIDLSQLVAGPVDVEGILDDRIDQGLLGSKGAEDGALSNARRFGNLPGAHLAAESFQQWLGGRDERGSALVEGQRRGTGHCASLVSERSLNKRVLQKKVRDPLISWIIRELRAVSHTMHSTCRLTTMPLGECEEYMVDLGQLTDEVFEAVIFDLDGTLIDSTPAVLRAWSAWESEYGLAPMDMLSHHGMPSASVVRAVMPEHLQESAMRRITEIEMANLYDVVVLPGAVEALASLASAKNAIATSCTVPLAEARITAARLVPPSVLVTVDDVVHGKPHPEPFLEAARRLGADPRRCLVIEDAPSGLEAARAAGCFTLAVVTTTPREALDADAIVADLSEVRFEVNHEGVRVRLVNEPAGALRQAPS
jgi:mannitol-1-/sugar-/sorbitol-6-phosphatase